MTGKPPTDRRSFDAFPYKPYDVQQAFMENLYAALERGGVSLFESPTGTGKTLSLICGTLKWLEEKKEADAKTCQPDAQDEQEGEDKENLPDWMVNFSLKALQSVAGTAGPSKKSIRTPDRKSKPKELRDQEADYLPDAWNEDELVEAKRRRLSEPPEVSESATSPDKEVVYNSRQVYFISRTHSQLSQFVGELQKTRYKDSMTLAALASRQALCINSEVTKLKSAAAINERCLELQKPAQSQVKGKVKKKSCKCPYFSAKRSATKAMQEAILENPMDVEDLGKLGAAKGVCPYYAARAALPTSDLVLLPYTGLLSQEARDAFGVRLKGSIVIIDEAHNLVDAVNGVHASTLALPQLRAAHYKLSAYHTKFQARLAQGNEQNIQLLVHVTERLDAFLSQQVPSARSVAEENSGSSMAVSKVNDFLFMTGLDSVNFFMLRRYIHESKIIFKVAGYHETSSAASPRSASETPAEIGEACRGTAPLQALASFCTALSNRDTDGRIVVDRSGQALKFILLHAAQHFAKVISQAHAVVLASGTLSPIESLKAQLFPNQNIRAFSCGHVVPKENLLAIALQKGPSGEDLDFRHQKRSQPSAIEQLGRLLLNFCRAVPQGIVVFFPSCSHAGATLARWEATGMMSQLQALKQVFTEPKTASQIDVTLRQYRKCIEGDSGADLPTGALLMCVVGGRLAEGINFADGMGRCVLMAGMPYPNPTDPELQERMQHMQFFSNSTVDKLAGRDWGRIYYDDLCFKAVNQCIGRVIRHAKDWAVIILADARWAVSNSHARSQLPGWIQSSLVVSHSFGEAYSQTTKFCKRMVQEA